MGELSFCDIEFVPFWFAQTGMTDPAVHMAAQLDRENYPTEAVSQDGKGAPSSSRRVTLSALRASAPLHCRAGIETSIRLASPLIGWGPRIACCVAALRRRLSGARSRLRLLPYEGCAA